jgi:hypothetical protein
MGLTERLVDRHEKRLTDLAVQAREEIGAAVARGEAGQRVAVPRLKLGGHCQPACTTVARAWMDGWDEMR